MKKLLIKILPESIKKLIRRYTEKYYLKKAYMFDRKRFSKSAFNIVKERNQENIEAKIIFHYHSLEKGLSNINFRLGFGERAYRQLIDTMHIYKNKGYDTKNITFMTGLSVLNEYVIKHKDTNIDTGYIENEIQKLSSSNFNSDLGGIYTLKKSDVIQNSRINFESLAMNRFSVRDYSNKQIDLRLIKKALSIAKKTPSVCNRQPWHSHIIRNKILLKSVLDVQGGLKGQGTNIDTLILITSNNNYLSNYTERNQGFTDCGMYAMSLIYSLQYLGLATCALNANLSINKDCLIRDLLHIPESHNLIMFIAVGEYEDDFKVPKSTRDDVESRSTFY